MLKKILGIANIGRFGCYSPTGDLEFCKLTLIFGENGRGKSTITSIIRSLQSGDGNHISERETLPIGIASPAVKVRLQTGSCEFKRGSWSSSLPDIEIFDAQFINDNVFSGLSVDHEHKRNLYRIIVGEQGVLLSQKVDVLDGKIRAINTELSEKKGEIKLHVEDSLEVDKFVALARFDKIDELILKKENEIVALKNAKEISAKDGFAEIALPSSPQIGIFSKALETLSQTAAKAVALHAKTLDSRTDTIERNAEKWIEAGVTYLQSETCPFCTQNTTGIDLVSSYQSYFSKAYKELKDDIRQHLKANDDRFGPKPLLAVQNNISGNIALTEFWKRFFEVKLGELPVPDVVQAFNALYTQMKTSLNAKSASPLDVVDATGSLNAALTEYHNLLAKGTTYNTSCKAMNEHVMKVKARAVGGNLAAAITDLSKLKNTKVRHEPFAAALCKEFLDLKRQKTAFDVEKEQAKSDLDKHSATIFSLYEVTMNDHLKLFGAEFLLANTSGNYVGGKPNSSYNITINTVPVDVDATIGKHCFKSALSGGDKSCLALAFFLARLDHDPRLADKIVVFDDPMCSMDRFRSDRTVKAIAELSGKAKQVVVLSHDSQFLRRIFDEVPPGNRKALCVQRVGAKESTLVEWDIVNATRSEYLQDYFALSDYLEKGVTGDMRALAVKIRVILEENLRMRFPDVFGSGQWLGNFLEAIRNANSGEVAYSMKPHLSELDALNDFSKKFHHAENPGASKECRFRSETVPVFQFDCLIGC